MGVRHAALFACAVMALAQVAVIAILTWQGFGLSAVVVGVFLAIQIVGLMVRLVRDPGEICALV